MQAAHDQAAQQGQRPVLVQADLRKLLCRHLLHDARNRVQRQPCLLRQLAHKAGQGEHRLRQQLVIGLHAARLGQGLHVGGAHDTDGQ